MSRLYAFSTGHHWSTSFPCQPFATIFTPRTSHRYGYQDAEAGTTSSASPVPAAVDGFRHDAPFAPIYLHAHSLVFQRPDRRPVRVVAPLPPHMRALLSSLKWSLQKQDMAAATRPPSNAELRRREKGRDGGIAKGVGRRGVGVLTKRGYERWHAVGTGRG
jgi:hypothetical protein